MMLQVANLAKDLGRDQKASNYGPHRPWQYYPSYLQVLSARFVGKGKI